jgi:hypothetical protein
MPAPLPSPARPRFRLQPLRELEPRCLRRGNKNHRANRSRYVPSRLNALRDYEIRSGLVRSFGCVNRTYVITN